MKGKIILTDITNPVEGMHVVLINQSGEVADYGTIIEVATQPENHNYHDVEIGGRRYYAPQHLLKQIAVEYNTTARSKKPEQKDSLPLHPDNWNTAIALIGHEVEFRTFETADVLPDPKRYAKLVLPTPVRTIKDIPEELRHLYPENFNGNSQDSVPWPQIFAECAKNKGGATLGTLTQYLSQNFYPPKRKPPKNVTKTSE